MESRVEYRDSSVQNGKPPCRIEVYTMPAKGKRKANKKQRRKSPARIDIFAAATFWVLRIIFLLWDRFSR